MAEFKLIASSKNQPTMSAVAVRMCEIYRLNPFEVIPWLSMQPEWKDRMEEVEKQLVAFCKQTTTDLPALIIDESLNRQDAVLQPIARLIRDVMAEDSSLEDEPSIKYPHVMALVMLLTQGEITIYWGNIVPANVELVEQQLSEMSFKDVLKYVHTQIDDPIQDEYKDIEQLMKDLGVVDD